MGILDNQLLKKIQENLLLKADQNKILTKRLGLSTTIGKLYHKNANIQIFGDIVDWTEDVQLNMLGASRHDFIETMKNYREPDDETKSK